MRLHCLEPQLTQLKMIIDDHALPLQATSKAIAIMFAKPWLVKCDNLMHGNYVITKNIPFELILLQSQTVMKPKRAFPWMNI